MKKIILLFICIIAINLIKAQDRVITTGVPFLLVAADARAAGMSDQGVATSSDVFSQQWNPAKYAFSSDKYGVSLNYTPYLTSLVNDISLSQLTFYDKINDRSAFASSLRYFSLGTIELRGDSPDGQKTEVKPAEYAFDLSYSLKLSSSFSMAVAGRFIRSNLGITSAGQSTVPASSFAFDVASFYQSEEMAFNNFNGRWRAGLNFQNMGPKINYDETQADKYANFLPSNMRLGGAFDFIFDDSNKLTTSLELAKLLVPTPPDVTGLSELEASQKYQEYRSIGWFAGMFKSLADAPGGFKEEMQEVTYSLATEYMYQDSFAMRLGYFHESPHKGARQFLSLGAGFKYTTIRIDLSYLFSTSTIRNPLENTLRFSLTFNFGDKYDNN